MDTDASAQRRPRLTPAIADVRRAVREALAVTHSTGARETVGGAQTSGAVQETHGAQAPGAARAAATVLVGLSGGTDSLALAAATAFEAPRAGIRAGAVIVDHGLQEGSAEVARRAAAQASELGLDPVLIRASSSLPRRRAIDRNTVSPNGHLGARGEETGGRTRSNGPEADARDARYGAFREALVETGAAAILLAHTLDDQAETVLLGLARGAGAHSLRGMAGVSGPYLRPLLGIRRATTRQFCADAGLEPWDDPHNIDPSYARVRVRTRLLPAFEDELGPGITEALARTAEQLREDSDALDAMVLEAIEDICEPAEAGVAVSVGALAANPPALRNRIIRVVASSEFGVSLERVHVLAVARLITDWHGQKPLDLPGVRVARHSGMLVFQAAASVQRPER